MSALTATTTFCPSSFQLKFASSARKIQLASARWRLLEIDRRSANFASLVVRSSAVNGNGVERRPAGNSSWNKSNSSADDFSGWANSDAERNNSGDSQRKKSLVGILGAGAAGVLLVAGLTFTALSISNRRTSRVKQQMEPLTTQQENTLSSDEHQDNVEGEKSEENLGIPQTGSEEIQTGTDGDLPLNKQNYEASENRISEESQESAPKESAIIGSLDSAESTEKPPVSDIMDDSSTSPSIQNEPKAEIFDDAKIDPSVFDANSENILSDKPNGISGLETSNISENPSSVDPSILQISVEPQLDEVHESNMTSKEFMEASVDRDDQYPEGKVGSTAVSLVPEVPYQFSNEERENDYTDFNVKSSFTESRNPGFFFTSAGIPAPSVVSAALQAPRGKVLVPAVVDQLQSQAVSALQVLKVIEEDVQPGDLCTRREYARWLVLASSALSRNTTSKVYPAMYIENFSELAFDDITPEDPDFPAIQGLAEAGLIASKLSRRDMQSSVDEDPSPLFFSPESPASRQDLVSWKMALEKRQLPIVDRKTLQQLSGFLDIDKIDVDAWPALVADLAAGEQGIITLAFGYTRLFQPEKPVTIAQAAIALSTGDASAIVSEELARIEAESMAEKAVSTHTALLAEVEKDLNSTYEKELFLEREKIDAIEKLAESARLEVEKLRAEREAENVALMKDRAAVDSEMEVLSRLRREMEEQLQTLMSDKVAVSYEKERLSKLRKDAESENEGIERLQYELEVERKALAMARSWAEDETKRAREQAKALEEARVRWESKGLKVVVDNDLREEEEAGITWLDAGKQSSVAETVERSENLVEKLRFMADEVRGKCKETINKIIEKIVYLVSILKEKALKMGVWAGEVKDDAKLRLENSLQGVQYTSGEFASSVKRVAGDWKVGVERLSQKFKT